MKKVILSAIIVIACVLQINAQDKIYLTNGDEIKAKIEEISETEIKYHLWDNQGGPMRSVAKTNVFIIIYKNGYKEVFSTIKSQSSDDNNVSDQSNASLINNPLGNEIGKVHTFDDGSKGVIFYYSSPDHGLVVSLDENELKWQNEKNAKNCQDIYNIANETNPSVVDVVVGLGLKNTNNMLQQLGNYMAPAATFCKSHGESWYLPSASELYLMLVIANKSMAENGILSQMLVKAGGQPISDGWYWSSSEENAKNAHNIRSTGNIATDAKNKQNYVRAVRVF